MIKIDFSDGIVAGDALRRNAILFIKSKLYQEPKNISYLVKLVQLLREQGLINQAIVVLERILKLEPNNEDAICLYSVLNEDSDQSACNKPLRPTPFFYLADFLSKKRN
jgi:predicted Zn-dependent protease